MICRMMINRAAPLHRTTAQAEPNHRQHLALERIEFAVGELATIMLSCCRDHDAIRDVRKVVAPVVADILSEE
jgi:hypothetical protein